MAKSCPLTCSQCSRNSTTMEVGRDGVNRGGLAAWRRAGPGKEVDVADPKPAGGH